jgi:hypothetical protein
MADNTLIVCGGTGAHVALSFLRLHSLGASLGYFRRPDGKLFVFPEIFLVDQDAGDGAEAGPTAWQEVRRLVERHTGRLDRAARMGRHEAPILMDVRPLPLGSGKDWYRPPFNNLQSRFGASPLLPALTAEKQCRIEYSKGMMGSPAVGSLLFKLKEYDEKERGINNDERFGALLRNTGRIVVAGSGVGGTGAAVTPTLARRLAENSGTSVMAAILLSWFKFNENVPDQLLRERAALKNKVLLQNGHSALEFCGQSLSAHVATVPIGMPDNALVVRDFTADFAQPVCESFALYVAALSAFRHFVGNEGYRHGLYAMGASERGRLDGKTPIPGGTLQDLVNRAATLVDLLKIWERTLAANQVERIVPSIYAAVRPICDPRQVAAALAEERQHFEAQLETVSSVLRLKPEPESSLSFEQRSREWTGRVALGAAADSSPLQTALALFHWTADRIVEAASPRNLLTVAGSLPRAAHWPDLHQDGIGIPISKNGDLEGVAASNIPAVIQAFIDRRRLSANGWPHPLAAADFFKHAILQKDPAAWRQLEILAVGVASGQLVVRPIGRGEQGEPVSLEALVKDYQLKEGYEGIAQLGIYLPQEGGAGRLLAFSSPFSLFAPVPYLDDAADNALWQALWERLSGAANGEHWAVARQQPWKEHHAVRLVRSWLSRERRNRGSEGPVWANLFESYPAGPGEALVGSGPGMKVYWKGSQLVDLNLPSASISDWIPQPGTPDRQVEELRQVVPELARWGGYEEVLFEMPGERDLMHGFWREHLLELQQSGKIFAFGQQESPARMVAIGTLVQGELRKTLLPDTLVLSRPVIAVQQVTPLEQRPIHSSGEGIRRFPDLPLRPEFIGLVDTPDGPLLQLAKKGDGYRELRFRPVESKDPSGRPMVSWTLQLRGRRDPLVIPISLENEPSARAHWMVWPRFRSQDPAGWRAYYLYDHCSNGNLVCDTLWLEGSEPRLQLKTRQDPNRRVEALRFATGQAGAAHSGGPPIALSLRNFRRDGEHRGLYLVGLETLPTAAVALNLGVDFGTSHSVVAFDRSGSKDKEVVELPAELDGAAKSKALSLHISEDRLHLEEDQGLGDRGEWMPNYRSKVAAMVPSELLLSRPLERAKSDDLTAWQPLLHYTIPPLDLARPDMGDFLVSGFKWDASSTHFQGREPQLREHYQSLLLELALADVVANRIRCIPSGKVGITFCYPLRIQEHQVGSFKETFSRVLRRITASTGIGTELFRNIGLLDESRAAAVRTEVACEVCQVADLGGGTLDILISGYDAKLDLLPEVADSARLGGNLLLQEMAAGGAYLPREGGWDKTEGSARMAQLVAWIRGRGTQGLWGVNADKPSYDQLGLKGFELSAQADPARRLITRYFNLIVEFLARNLASYLFEVWYPRVDPADHSRLRLSVQLRGNGWKLHYAGESELARTQAVQEMVKARLAELWQEIPGNVYPLPATWLNASYFQAEAKAAPAKGSVGQAMAYEEVRQSWHTRTLVDLEVLRGSGATTVRWFDRVPFVTGGAKTVQIGKVAPPVPIDPIGDDRGTVIRELDADRQGEVNRALQRDGRIDGVRFFAPVAAEVWEALFRLPEFWPHRKGGAP